jgi:hypothetical protein
MLNREMDEGIVVKIRKDQVKFLNSTFPVPKSNGKCRKVVSARRLNAGMREINFRMDGADVVQDTAMENDRASSHDLTKAFNHVLVKEEFVPYPQGKLLRLLHAGTMSRTCTRTGSTWS